MDSGSRTGLRRISYLMIGTAAGYFLMSLISGRLDPAARLQQGVTVFLSIYIEAVPFLLLGAIASGFIEEFLDENWLKKVQGKSRIGTIIPGALLGLVTPVCECGIVPLTRRLLTKGLSPAAGIAFLLATPVVNPIVIFSTWAATGSAAFTAARVLAGLVIAVLIGYFFSFAEKPEALLQQRALPQCRSNLPCPAPGTPRGAQRLHQVREHAVNDFLENNQFLVLGSLLATAVQLFIPQSFLLSLGTSPVLSHLVMIVLAALLSVCSTVDAFVAKAFVNTFSKGSILAFLVFGPMIDIKAAALYLTTFKVKTVFQMAVLAILLTLVAAAVTDLAGFL